MEKEEIRSMKMFIISFIVFVWICASIILMVVSGKQKNYSLMLIVMGQFFLLIGTAALIAMSGNKSSAWLIDLIPIAAGIGCLSCGIIMGFGPSGLSSGLLSAMPVIVGAFAAVSAGSFLLGEIISYRALKRKCTTEIHGECIRLDLRERKASPVYGIYTEGNRSELSKPVYSRFSVPSVGERRTLFIDPGDLSTYYEPVTDDRVHLFTALLLSLFILAGIVLVILGVYSSLP